QVQFADLHYQYHVEKPLRQPSMSNYSIVDDLQVTDFSQLTFAACTPRRTLIADRINRTLFLLNRDGNSVLKSTSGKAQSSLFPCRQLTSSIDFPTFWKVQERYQFYFDAGQNGFLKLQPAQKPISPHPLNSEPHIFSIGDYLFSISDQGKISCFDKSGQLIKEQSTFSTQNRYQMAPAVYQLGAHFLILPTENKGPQQFFAVSCDETMSITQLQSDLSLKHHCVPLGSNGQSCFISLQDNTFKFFLVALTIRDKKLKTVWKSQIPQPETFVANERYVIIGNQGTNTVLSSVTGEKRGIGPLIERGIGPLLESADTFTKTIGPFFIRSHGTKISIWNLSTNKQVRKFQIPLKGLQRIHDVYFQRPGRKQHDLPLGRVHVLYTHSNRNSIQAGFCTLTAPQEQPKQAVPKAESKEQPTERKGS
nr:hypothetical protein [Parachlamydiaceae bacterium]